MMCLSFFSSKQCIIKQLLDSGSVIPRIIKVSVSVISLDLDYSGYHKNLIQLLFIILSFVCGPVSHTVSNTCVLYELVEKKRKCWFEIVSKHCSVVQPGCKTCNLETWPPVV